MTKSSKKNLRIKLKKYKILHNSSMIIYEKFNNKASKKKKSLLNNNRWDSWTKIQKQQIKNINPAYQGTLKKHASCYIYIYIYI
jgi:cobalamin-dependent methionine synthase I